MKRSLALGLSLLLLLGAALPFRPVEASPIGWNNTEYLSLQKFYLASQNWYSATAEMESGLVHGTTTTNLSRIVGAWVQLSIAAERLAEAVGWFSDIDPTNTTTVVEGLGNRASYVTNAKAAVTNMVTAMQAAQVHFQELGRATCQPSQCCNGTVCFTGTQAATFRSDANAAAAFLFTAIAAGQAISQSASYSNPWNSWYPRCVGPHGDGASAKWHLARAAIKNIQGYRKLAEMLDWVTNGEPAWSGSSGAYLKGFARTHLRIGNVNPGMTSIALALISVGAPPGATYVTQDFSPAQLILRSFIGWQSTNSPSQDREHRVTGIPYNFRNYSVDAFWVLNEGVADPLRPVSAAIWDVAWPLITADAWGDLDFAWGECFKFPDDATLKALRANPPAINDIGGPSTLKLSTQD